MSLRASFWEFPEVREERVRNAAETIVWHGGEAVVSRDALHGMSKERREASVRFVESI